MKIKITYKNTDKIEKTLLAVNGKANSFCITRCAEVQGIAHDMEARLSMLPKPKRVGACVSYSPAGPSANSYKYEAISTTIVIRRFATGWFLTDVRRRHVWPGSQGGSHFGITPIQSAEIQRRAVDNFHVTKVAT